MGIAGTTHQKVIDLLNDYAPSPPWDAVYNTHETANLIIPSLSVEVETDTPLTDDAALVQQELLDNRNVRLTIRIHTGYRLGLVNTTDSVSIIDIVVRWLRENVNLDDGYRIFDVVGVVYNIEHTSSGTTGGEVTVDVHKVEYYVQS